MIVTSRRHDNTHMPAPFQVESVKVDLSNVGSRIGSMANVKHKPQGGDKKIFNDVEYMRQVSSGSGEGRSRRRSQASSLDGTPEPPVRD